jgi:hypothetical protein
LGATLAREAVIANSQFGAGAIAGVAPATWYVGLSVGTPGNDGSGFIEPTGGAYARVAVTNNATNWPAATVGSDGLTRKTNGAKITFPNPTGNWGQVGYWGLFLAASGGTPEWVQALDAPISPRSGNTPVEFDIGQLIMTFS